MRPGRAISRRTIASRPGPAVARPVMRSVRTAASASRPPRAATWRATISSTVCAAAAGGASQRHRGEDEPCAHGAHLGTGLGRATGRLGATGGLTTGPVGQ